MRKMGRITEYVQIENAIDSKFKFNCNALVDTGSAFVVLPTAWKARLGKLDKLDDIKIELGDQTIKNAEIYGPLKIKLEGFRAIYTEVIFLEMDMVKNRYEPLIGYIALEQAQAVVDMLGHRLVPVKYVDLKKVA